MVKIEMATGTATAIVPSATADCVGEKAIDAIDATFKKFRFDSSPTEKGDKTARFIELGLKARALTARNSNIAVKYSILVNLTAQQ